MNMYVRSCAVVLITLLFSFVSAEELAPEHVPGATTVDGVKAKELFDKGVLFVDPRKDADFEAGRIPGAAHLNSKKTLSEKSLSAEAEKGEEIVFYCNGIKCLLSSQASKLAVNWGFTKVYYYRGGFPDWQSRGYPVE